jgi:hypothetical protein
MDIQNGTPYPSADDLTLTAHFDYHEPAAHGGEHHGFAQNGVIDGDFADPAVQKFTLIFELTCSVMETTFVFTDLTLPDGEWLSRTRWAEFVAAHRAQQEDGLEFRDKSGICTFDGDAVFFYGGPGGKTETALAGELCFEPFERVSAELEKCENSIM